MYPNIVTTCCHFVTVNLHVASPLLCETNTRISL